MKQILKEQAHKYLPQMLAGAIGFLTWKILNFLIFPMLPELYKIIDIKSVLLLLILSVLLNFAFLILIIVSIFKENKNQIPEPRLYYGIYFDWLFNPLCPSCKSPLQVESLTIEKQYFLNKPKLICPNGHYNQIPTDDIGTELHIASMRATLIKDRFGIKDNENKKTQQAGQADPE